MFLGNIFEGTKTIPIQNNRKFSPLLIVGKDSAIETLQNLFLEEIYEGKGATYFGDAEKLLQYIPPERIKDTILFELDYDYPIAFNPLQKLNERKRSQIADYVVEAFATAYPSNIPTALLDNNLLMAGLVPV